MFVNAGPQAVRAAWVNIWGVRRMCGILLMFNVLFASYALAPFSVLREYGSFEKVSSFAFRLACGRFCVLCDKRNRRACATQSVPVRSPERLGLRVLRSRGFRGEKQPKVGWSETMVWPPSAPSQVEMGRGAGNQKAYVL